MSQYWPQKNLEKLVCKQSTTFYKRLAKFSDKTGLESQCTVSLWLWCSVFYVRAHLHSNDTNCERRLLGSQNRAEPQIQILHSSKTPTCCTTPDTLLYSWKARGSDGIAWQAFRTGRELGVGLLWYCKTKNSGKLYRKLGTLCQRLAELRRSRELSPKEKASEAVVKAGFHEGDSCTQYPTLIYSWERKGIVEEIYHSRKLVYHGIFLIILQ